MIVTITLNPAVDISYTLEQFEMDTVNRVENVTKTAGGKGLNVARVLRQLGESVGASGFLGGTLGEFVRSELATMGIKDLFVQIEGDTRNCIAVIHEGKQTEILESGPVILANETAMFLEQFTTALQNVEIVTISGSLPKGLPTHFYVDLVKQANANSTYALLDSNGKILASIIENEHKPFLLKPNEEELAELLGQATVTETEIVDALQSTLFEGIAWVVVTLGAKGAIIKHNKAIYRAVAPAIEAVNPVGSGDSVIAGFAAGISRELMDEPLIKLGLAMGVLNAMEKKTGHINVEKVTWAVNQIQVEKLK